MNLQTKLASGLFGIFLLAFATLSCAAGSNSFDVRSAALSLNTFSSMTFVPSRAISLAADDDVAYPAEPAFDDRSLLSATSFQDVENAEPLLATGGADPLFSRKPANGLAELLAGLSLVGFALSRRARLL